MNFLLTVSISFRLQIAMKHILIFKLCMGDVTLVYSRCW